MYSQNNSIFIHDSSTVKIRNLTISDFSLSENNLPLFEFTNIEVVELK